MWLGVGRAQIPKAPRPLPCTRHPASRLSLPAVLLGGFPGCLPPRLVQRREQRTLLLALAGSAERLEDPLGMGLLGVWRSLDLAGREVLKHGRVSFRVVGFEVG